MKDGKFETQAEIYQALLDGKKVFLDHHTSFKYLHFLDGTLKYDNGLKSTMSFSLPNEWQLYQEPKTPEKVKIVAHIAHNGAIDFANEDSSLCRARDNSKDYKRLSLSFDAEVLS